MLISKVARVGLRDWPELLPALLQVCVHVAKNNCVIYFCILYVSFTLLHVLLLKINEVVNLLLEISVSTQLSC